MLTNFHTHTYRCLHAGTAPDEDYVLAAIRSGYQILGFSDHCPWPYDNGFVNNNARMPIEQLEDYFTSIESLKEKYADQIEIRLGLEVEHFPKYYDWFKCIYPRLDYAILGNHHGLDDSNKEPYYGMISDPKLVEQYSAYTIDGMGTGLFSYVAHPDLPFANYPEFDETACECSRMLCREAKAIGMPLEYNLYGVRKIEMGHLKGVGYPAKQFWEIAAELGCTAIIGVDAHDPQRLMELNYMKNAKSYLESLGLKVIDNI